MKLYHFTDATNLPSIRKRGLLPRAPRCECHAGMGKVVWFTTLAPRPGEAFALLVDIERSDPRLEFVERLGPGAEWWVYRDTIPPEKIAVTAVQDTALTTVSD